MTSTRSTFSFTSSTTTSVLASQALSLSNFRKSFGHFVPINVLQNNTSLVKPIIKFEQIKPDPRRKSNSFAKRNQTTITKTRGHLNRIGFTIANGRLSEKNLLNNLTTQKIQKKRR